MLGCRGWKGGGQKGWGAQNFALFFPLPPQNSIFSSLSGGSSRGFLVVFEAPGHSNVHVWALGLSCETPAEEKKERNFGRSWGGLGKGGPGKAGLGKGGPGGTQHDQTKTLKPTPTPHSTNTHQRTQTHTHTHTNTHKQTQTHTNTQHKHTHTAQVELGLAKVGLARRAKPGAAAAARPRPLTSLKVRIEGGGVSCALSVD